MRILSIALLSLSAFAAMPVKTAPARALGRNPVLQSSIDQGLRRAPNRPRQKKQRKAVFLRELRKLYEPAQVPLSSPSL